MADKPVTREEKYLAYLTGDYNGELPKPITRKEKYLYELCLKGMGGEISPEEIKNAVNEYLEKNPVKPGATTEQAQQIEQNKTDIGSLKEDIGDIFTIGKNQFDINNLTNEVYSSNGELTDNLNYLLTDFIDVRDKQGYYIASSYNGYFVQFDSSKTFISKIENILYSHNRTIASNAAYIRIGIGKKVSEIQDETVWIEKEKITEAPLYDKHGKHINDDVDIPPDNRVYIGQKIPNGGTKDGDQTISIGKGACRDEKCGIIAIGVDAASKTESTDESDNGHYSIAIGHRALQKNVKRILKK